MKKTTKEINLDRALWDSYSIWVVRTYLLSNYDLLNENIITNDGKRLYLSKLTLVKYIVATDKEFIERWKKFHIKASKKLEFDNAIKSKIISALYRKINEEKSWVRKKTKGITAIISSLYRIGKKDESIRNQKKYEKYIIR
jgi:hypothetical protein